MAEPRPEALPEAVDFLTALGEELKWVKRRRTARKLRSLELDFQALAAAKTAAEAAEVASEAAETAAKMAKENVGTATTANATADELAATLEENASAEQAAELKATAEAAEAAVKSAKEKFGAATAAKASADEMAATAEEEESAKQVAEVKAADEAEAAAKEAIEAAEKIIEAAKAARKSAEALAADAAWSEEAKAAAAKSAASLEKKAAAAWGEADLKKAEAKRKREKAAAGKKAREAKAAVKVAVEKEADAKKLEAAAAGSAEAVSRRKEADAAKEEAERKIAGRGEVSTGCVLEDGLRANLCGLAISGGGIRSATFGLGVLQGLAATGLLKRFDYLSTVSGGGFIGSWLSAWIHREGIDDVCEKLKPARLRESPIAAEPAPSAERSTPTEPQAETRQITFLRRYSNYLAPIPSPFSVDGWVLIAIYLRNLLLNQFVLLLATLGVVFAARSISDVFDFVSVCGSAVLGSALISTAVAALGAAVCRLHVTPLRATRTLVDAKESASAPWCSVSLRFLVAKFRRARNPCFRWLRADVRRITPPWKAGWCGRLCIFLNREWRPFTSRTERERWELVLRCMFAAVVGAAAMTYPPFRWVIETDEVFWSFLLAVSVGGAATHYFLAGALPGVDVWGRLYGVIAGGLLGALAAFVANFLFKSINYLEIEESGLMIAVFGPPLLLTAFVLANFLQVGLLGTCLAPYEREWWSGLNARLAMAAVGWALTVGGVEFCPLIYEQAVRYEWQTPLAALLGSSWAVATASGLWAAWTSGGGGRKSRFRELLALVAPWMFLTGLFAAVALLAYWATFRLDLPLYLEDHGWSERNSWTDVWKEPVYTVVSLVCATICLLFAWGFGRQFGVNKFSLHDLYALRLIRCYQGASREHRSPDPMTNFDEDDDLHLAELAGPPKHRGWAEAGPFHILNGALNRSVGTVVPGREDESLAFLDRRAESFTFSPLRCGSKTTSYCPTSEFSLKPQDLGGAQKVYEAAAKLRSAESWYEEMSAKVSVFEAKVAHWTAEVPALKGLDSASDVLHAVRDAIWDAKRAVWEAKAIVVDAEHAIGEANRESVKSKFRAASSKVSIAESKIAAAEAKVAARLQSLQNPDPLKKGVRLGTAVATSGAAISPNGGFHTAAAVSALLTVFNLRLGAWFGNPGRKEHRGNNNPPPWYLLKELFTSARADGDYVYVSDGGHFENMGVYELIRRRCRFIVAVDPFGDPQRLEENLGNLVRKVRIDFGIRIEVASNATRTGPDGRSSGHVAVGRIFYGDVHVPPEEHDEKTYGPTFNYDANQGILVYLKAGLTGDEPADLLGYREANPLFPNDPILDQNFDEAQFESYRVLGLHTVNALFKEVGAGRERTSVTLTRESEGLKKLRREKTRELFERIYHVWLAPPAEMQAEYIRLNEVFAAIHEKLRSDPDLRRFARMLHEMPEAVHPSPVRAWDAPLAERLMAVEMLTLLENAFLRLQMERYHRHPINAGWLDVFDRWSRILEQCKLHDGYLAFCPPFRAFITKTLPQLRLLEVLPVPRMSIPPTPVKP